MTNYESEETANIFREECEEILKDFNSQLQNFIATKDVSIVVKLMRDAHSVKGSAGIVGLQSVQKLAHKIEDLLGLLKENPQDANDEMIAEIQALVGEIANLVNNSQDYDDNFSIEESLDEIISKIPSLKNDVGEVEYMQNLVAKIQASHIPDDVQDILTHCYNVLDKLKQSHKIKDNNILNILAGSFKIIRKIVCENCNDYNDELIFLKQRISVASEMIDFFIEAKKKTPDNQETIKPKIEIHTIFRNLGQGSIKTLRIETVKLDELYENIYNLGNLADSARENFLKTIDLTEQFSGKIFEFEKILTNLKRIAVTDNEQNNSAITLQTQQIENCLNDIQILMKEYEKVNCEKNIEDKQFNENLYQIKKSIQNIRILPLGVILHMFPRMVRDIAESENKEVEIDITGGETSVDKKILEEIKMPLIHLLRNAVDHGTELPEERENQGKSRAGKISISAKNDNGKVIICVKDDGCGINFDKIKAKALKEKILGKKEIKTFKRHDFLKMIFRPGFSTEDKVTEISGRGYGLDIVYTKIAELNGDIKINTQKGKGTEIIMEIPSGFQPFDLDKTDNETQFAEQKIAIVDDSRTTKIYLKKILADNGYTVDAFDDGKSALEAFKQNDYALLISDIEMPGMNGAELVMKIRKIKKYKSLPVVIISMLSMERAVQLFKNIPIDTLFNKSDFKELNFVQTINSILNKN